MSLVQSTARTIMQDAEHDLPKAKRLARERICDDGLLQNALWQWAIDRLLEEVWRSGRAEHWQRAEAGFPAVGEKREPAMRAVLSKGEVSTPSPSLMRAIQRELDGLMAYPMPDGTLLGNWNKRELSAHSRQEIAKAQGALRNNFWLLAVAQLLKRETDYVKDHLTNADLERLMRKQMPAKAS